MNVRIGSDQMTGFLIDDKNNFHFTFLCSKTGSVYISESGRAEKRVVFQCYTSLCRKYYDKLLCIYEYNVRLYSYIPEPACNLSKNSFKRFKCTRTNSCLKTFCSWCIMYILYKYTQNSQCIFIERHTCNIALIKCSCTYVHF